MLAGGVAFVALRRWSLYPAQVPSLRDSRVHREEHLEALSRIPVATAMKKDAPRHDVRPQTPVAEILRTFGDGEHFESLPVQDDKGALVGVIRPESLLVVAGHPESAACTIAADVMQPPISVLPTDDLRHASRLMLVRGLHELPVVSAEGNVVGYLHEAAIARIYLESSGQAQQLE